MDIKTTPAAVTPPVGISERRAFWQMTAQLATTLLAETLAVTLP